MLNFHLLDLFQCGLESVAVYIYNKSVRRRLLLMKDNVFAEKRLDEEYQKKQEPLLLLFHKFLFAELKLVRQISEH